ncbi:MAG: hypothetical protein AB4042_20690, partial [Leptolyngbyaceae cyanobacterium]
MLVLIKDKCEVQDHGDRMGSTKTNPHQSHKNLGRIQRYLDQYAEPQVDSISQVQERLTPV